MSKNWRPVTILAVLWIFGKCLVLPRHDVVRFGRLRAFEEPVVGFVGGDGKGNGWLYEIGNLADGAQGGFDMPRLELQAGPVQHLLVLSEHGRRDGECDIPPKCEQQNRSLGADRHKQSRNDDVCIQHNHNWTAAGPADGGQRDLFTREHRGLFAGHL